MFKPLFSLTTFAGTLVLLSTPCIAEEGMPKYACDVHTDVSGNTMTFGMKCNTDGVIMTGSGKSVGEGGNVTSSSQSRVPWLVKT